MIAIVAGCALASVIGWWLNRRAGVLRTVAGNDSGAGDDTAASFLGLTSSGPTVVHFSAPWCGPCAGVRRVVDGVCDELGVAHREIDIDADPAAARRFSVLSLPTTLIFDADGRQRYRAAGVPTAAALRSALQPLLA
ncbi:thioredoxin family protein [Mycolicibacter sinensis]|jgi:thiol-disulfide isomerase/thioredoxin|uniref:Thiol reductase thioredoxin n=1 Tax=Mycolicibacter sinensis (strain JDM601) TaxID=875328 RepID=A0A1A2DZR9_MYCSD|nr:thioredoxin family protein [Mycolicibacter sinensis]OBF97364.1 thiol reductase thioredoxin [Mycolicibacter sinensis]OBG08020.1 thiol reductase thioredoxin [Mycolicibacter sinensis]